LAEKSENCHVEGRGLKLLEKPSYDIWTFPSQDFSTTSHRRELGVCSGDDRRPIRRRLGIKLPAAGSKRSGAKPPALGNFSIKITYFYAYFCQNSYFKAISHQLKAFKISLNVPVQNMDKW